MRICFDFDGTLVNSTRDIAESVNTLRKRHGREPVDHQSVEEAIGHGVGPLVEQFFPPDSEDSTDRYIEQFRAIYRDACVNNIQPYPGIPKLLEGLRDHSLAIVTNKPVDMARRMVQTIGWDAYVRPVYGADSFDRRKPDPLPLQQVARDWGVEPDQLIMVGDNWSDVRAGNEVGAVTVGCLYGFGDTETLRKEEPDYLVERPRELQDLLTDEPRTQTN